MTAAAPGGDTPAGVTLAYVFWHQPAARQAPADYEAALTRFHRRLADAPVPGLLTSWALSVSDLPWLPGGGYEDRYLLRSYADLGDLNTAAVDVERREVHDDVAGRSGRGAGGLYGLSAGTADGAPAWITWLSKPREMPYPSFYEALYGRMGLSGATSLPSGLGVWRRQLVLGPAPEFCVTAPFPQAGLPDEWAPFAVATRPIHPTAAAAHG